MDHGKKVPKVMWKNLPRLHTRDPAQFFHLRPNLRARQASAASCNKNLSAPDPRLPAVRLQLFYQLRRQQDRAELSFVLDCNLPLRQALRGDEAQLRNAYACGRDGLNSARQTIVALCLRRPHKALKFRLCQVFLLGSIGAPLGFDLADLPVSMPEIRKKRIHRRNLPVDGGRGTRQRCLPLDHQLFG